ncbi:MAG: VWA domain-containing protein [Haliea sp.]|nr:VWA domain-containing protein [Haliea sp.]
MTTALSYAMTTRLGVKIPLVKTSIQGELRDTALETTVTQHYRNDEQETIEAVYTFPLPVGATLLSLEVNLNGETLAGTVVARAEAEAAYEDAITDGDSALMLQQIDEALYTLNIGNLQPGDSAVISIRYIQLLRWQQNSLRIMYPTTIGERYGQPAQLGMQPHQVPGADLWVEHRAEFSLEVIGQLASCATTCPSHSLVTRSEHGRLLITSPTDGVAMDRDIVICVERKQSAAASAGYFDPDLEGKWVGWLTVNPQVSHAVKHRYITIVVDCSGSMGGISNEQARVAVREIVENLTPDDTFNIVKFGSDATALFPEAMPGSDKDKTKALHLIADMDADMGGTEIGAALELAYTCAKGMRETGDILLITDGQSYDVVSVIHNAERSGCRHFTIGVGTAVAEDMVEGLARATGGAHEYVSPNENMAEAIVRHVKRGYAARLSNSQITWPIKPEQSIPNIITHAFSGDTLNLFARFDSKPEGDATVQLEFGEQTWSQNIQLSAYSDTAADSPLQELRLARVCAARQIQETTDDTEKQHLGIRYQLQTNRTSHLLVAKRDDKDETVDGPALRKIPQMSKANEWQIPDTLFKRSLAPERDSMSIKSPSSHFAEINCDVPMPTATRHSKWLARDVDLATLRTLHAGVSPEMFSDRLNTLLRRTSLFSTPRLPTTLDDLQGMGVDSSLMLSLRALHARNPCGMRQNS